MNLVTAGANYEEIAQKFQTSQAAKAALPGLVVLSDVWWFRYFSNGNIIPLDGLIKQLDIKVDDFQKSLVADYQYTNRQWALPYGRSTPLFYYNKDHFKAAGLPDRAPKTWQEFAEWAPKLKASSGAQYAYIYPALAGYAGWTLQNNLWGWGGSWSNEWTINCDSAESVDGAAVGPGLHLQGRLGRRFLQGGGRRLRRRHHLVHDLLHRVAARRPEVGQVQRRRRLPSRRPQGGKRRLPNGRRGLGHSQRRQQGSPARGGHLPEVHDRAGKHGGVLGRHRLHAHARLG